jgi:uncharacterized membrane protein YqjE
MDAPASPPGSATTDDPPHALRGLFAAALEMLRTRLDLAAVEFEIHLQILLRALVWALGAVACALLAVVFGITALVVALWDTHRMLALLGGCALFVALAVILGWVGARTVRNQPAVLEGSLAQLREDQRRAGGEP